MEITIKISDLEDIVKAAKLKKESDSSLGNTVNLKQILESQIHGASDTLEVRLNSAYAECNGLKLGYIRQLQKFKRI